MIIKVFYYAHLKELKGISEEELEISKQTVKEIFVRLFEKWPEITQNFSHLRVAINNEYVEWDAPLKEGDELLFVPPVSGG